MTCATCTHSAATWDMQRMCEAFVCQRDGYPVRVMRRWQRPCYIREPGAEG